MSQQRSILSPALLLAWSTLLLLSGCSGEPKSPQTPAKADKRDKPEADPAKSHPNQTEDTKFGPDASSSVAETQAVLFGKGVAHSLKLPKGWKTEPPANNMRLVQAAVLKHADDGEDAEFTVTKASGGVEANITRWANNLFGGAESLSNRRTLKTVSEKEATLADYEGTYTGMTFGPKQAEPKKNYKMLGAIVVAEDGEYFIRLTGPKQTVEQWKSAFDPLVQSFQ